MQKYHIFVTFDCKSIKFQLYYTLTLGENYEKAKTRYESYRK